MSSRAKVNRLATKDINRVTAYLESEIEALKKRTVSIEEEDIDQLIRDVCTEEFEKLGEGLLIETIEDKLDLQELADAVSSKVIEKLGM